MFVKFIRNPKSKQPVVETYECDYTRTSNLPDESGESVVLEFYRYNSNDPIHQECVSLSRTEVYFMNNFGKTIDSWRPTKYNNREEKY